MLEQRELLHVHHDQHLGSHAVVGRSASCGQRRGAQLLEGIGAALLGTTVLTGGIGPTEGPQCDPCMFRGAAVQQAGEGEPAVLRIAPAEAPVELLAALIRSERRGPDTGEHLTCPTSEGHWIERTGELQQFLLDPRTLLRLHLPQDAGDQARLGRTELPVTHRPVGRFVLAGGTASLDRLLDLARWHPLLTAELTLMIEGGPGRRRLVHRSQPTALGERCSTRAETLELRDRPTQPRQQLIDMRIGQLIQLPMCKRIYLLLYPRKQRQRPRLGGSSIRLSNGSSGLCGSSIALPNGSSGLGGSSIRLSNGSSGLCGSSIALPPGIGGHDVAGRRRCALLGLHRRATRRRSWNILHVIRLTCPQVLRGSY